MQFNRSTHSSRENHLINGGIELKKLGNGYKNTTGKGKNSFDQVIITAVETSRLLGSHSNNVNTIKYLN